MYIYAYIYNKYLGFPAGISGKETACQCRKHKQSGFNPWVGKISWRARQPPKYSCLENPHGQRCLAGYSPWGCNMLDMTEQLYTVPQSFQPTLTHHLRCSDGTSSRQTFPGLPVLPNHFLFFACISQPVSEIFRDTCISSSGSWELQRHRSWSTHVCTSQNIRERAQPCSRMQTKVCWSESSNF